MLPGIAVAAGGTLVVVAAAVAFAAAPEPTPTGPPAPADTPRPDPLAGVELDALQSERIAELREFAAWLDENGAEGFVGEVGWPAVDGWPALAESWFAVADHEGVPSTAWASGSWWSPDYRLTVHGRGAEGRVLGTANSQADVVEGGAAPGVNLAGLEFSTEAGFSAAEPGRLGEQYFAEDPASYAYLAERGIVTVRLPIRWERVQPVPFAELDADHVALLAAQLDAAEEAGIRVVLDLHNYGVFQVSESEQLRLGSTLGADALVDVWARLDAELAAHPAIAAYGLMNEPHSLADDDAAGARLWEQVSADAVTALRDAGVEHELYVPGYDWSSLARWAENHPTGWIDDPLDRIRYEAHHYWDDDGSGFYERSYAEELAAAGAAGE